MPVPVTAVQLATYVRTKFPEQERGALLVEGTADEGLVLAVFGNDRYLLDKRVNREVELVRQWLTTAGARELGFGVSPDGQSWALLVEVDDHRYQTAVGRAFHAELVRAEVEEEVDRAWLTACGSHGPPASGRRAGTRRRAG